MYKFNRIFCLLVLLCMPVASMQAQYVSEAWNPDLGNGHYKNPVLYADYSDPDVCAVGNDYYLTASSFNCVPGLPILHSTDLVHWTIIGHALSRLTPDSIFSNVAHGKGVWAPAIRYHSGKFYIYWGDPDRGIFMVNATNPAGEWSEPVCVVPGKGLIDPCPLWDDGGRCYLVNGWAASRSGINSVLTMRELSADGTHAVGKPAIVFDGGQQNHTTEGPKLYKQNGYYWILCPAGGVAHGWQLAMRSKHVFGPYECQKVMAQGNTTVNGPHQGAWVHTAAGEDWFMHFNDKAAYGRVVFLQPITWRDGWPVMGKMPAKGYCGEPLTTYTLPKTSVRGQGNPQESDEFNTTTLGLQWQWPANAQELFGLPMNNGMLRLYNIDEPAGYHSMWQMPNLLLQKLPAPVFTATAKLRVAAKEDNQYGGVVLMGMDYQALVVCSKAGKFELQLRQCANADKGSAETITPLRTLKPTSADTIKYWPGIYLDVYLRMQVADGKCQMSYSTDGKHFVQAGKPFAMRQGRWTGAKMGLVSACSQRKGNRGWVDADWFRVTR